MLKAMWLPRAIDFNQHAAQLTRACAHGRKLTQA
jgi:hypothetical protein